MKPTEDEFGRQGKRPSIDGLPALENYATSFPLTDRMPALFLGHGSPMNAIEENVFVKSFRELASTIQQPRAILCVSAHWQTRGVQVTAMEKPPTIHDFGGFPRELFEVEYPALGDPELARLTRELLSPNSVALDQHWGLDHGAWSVIRHLYPDASVPIIQLSVDLSRPPRFHFELGRDLRPLRDRGVLIIGSGNIVHNLRMADFARLNQVDCGYDWAFEAQSFVNKHVLDGNWQPLLNYEDQGRALQLSIPTPEHYLPLLYVLGLKMPDQTVSLFNDRLVGGSISMTSFRVD